MRAQHYTRNTLWVSKWCNRCKKNTPHRVTDRRANDCLDCIDKQEQDHRDRVAREIANEQKELFAC